GHRDTVFRRFGELEIGDRFIVEMPYGTYEYEMRESEIVGADDTSVIRPMGEEVLTVSTCYPFSYIGNAPDRFVLYAYPVGETEGKDQEEQSSFIYPPPSPSSSVTINEQPACSPPVRSVTKAIHFNVNTSIPSSYMMNSSHIIPNM